MGLHNTMLRRPICCIPIKERDAGVIFAEYHPTTPLTKYQNSLILDKYFFLEAIISL